MNKYTLILTISEVDNNNFDTRLATLSRTVETREVVMKGDILTLSDDIEDHFIVDIKVHKKDEVVLHRDDRWNYQFRYANPKALEEKIERLKSFGWIVDSLNL